MSWHGIGFISGRGSIPFAAGFIQRPPAQLYPSQQWSGQPGSGFAIVPSDPIRTTAKPALRLIVPPHQWFTDTLDVGVIAAANEEGTLVNNFGIADVTFHFEGSTAVVGEQTWHTVQTLRGPRTYLGWWVRLKKPAGVAGTGHLYVTATARDATMQRRVIGPFSFSPMDEQYDGDLTVAPSLPQVIGERYQTLNAAVQYGKTQGWHNFLVTISEPGSNYKMADSAPNAWARSGYCNITSSVPPVDGMPQVWIGTESEANPDVTMPDARMKLHIFGTGIGLDYANMMSIDRGGGGAGFDHWLDGIVMTNTRPGGRDALWRGGMRYSPNAVGSRQWMTECEVSEIEGPATFANLVRGCNFRRTTVDVMVETWCCIQSRFHDHSALAFNTNTPMFTIRYDGPESVATLSRRGGQRGLANSDGVGLYRVTIGTTNYDRLVGDNSAPYWNGSLGETYWFADLINWLNTIPGITAVHLANPDRAANSGGLGPEDSDQFPDGTKGFGFGFPANPTGPLDIKGVTKTVYSQYDRHSDWYQHNSGTLENVIVWANIVTSCVGQIIHLGPTGTATMRDIFFVGNALEQPAANAGNNSNLGRPTGNTTISHVVLAHNSLVTQRFRLWGSSGAGTNPVFDGYTMLKNNAMQNVFRDGPNSWAGLTIDGLHLPEGATPISGATNVSLGGADARAFFVDPGAGDFRPAGPLLDNLRPPAVLPDANQRRRTDPGPVGALA